MKNFQIKFIITRFNVSICTCSDDDDSTGDVVDPDQYVLSGVYTSDISLDANHIWTIRGRVYVSSGANNDNYWNNPVPEGGTGTNASFLALHKEAS